MNFCRMARLRLNILLNSIETFFSFLLRTIAAVASVMETSVVESAAPFIPMAGTPRSPKIRTAFRRMFRSTAPEPDDETGCGNARRRKNCQRSRRTLQLHRRIFLFAFFQKRYREFSVICPEEQDLFSTSRPYKSVDLSSLAVFLSLFFPMYVI